MQLSDNKIKYLFSTFLYASSKSNKLALTNEMCPHRVGITCLIQYLLNVLLKLYLLWI